ncbi:putative LRR receptor-like serine/threonine-protein kinase [Ananas comosus]|uniref:Putative LRR receptor-like serine/threonine-protein kinase n=1 Tax=Ananas comosus TaxID=4615 RepID=A0A199UZC7_ANACO|nr:putative LRR receptor-like serine/threonine-protein kinase [Ananas comosus]
MAHVTPPPSRRRRRRRHSISTVRSATCPHLRPLPLLAATLLLLCSSSPASASATASPAGAAATGLLELRASLGLRARDWPRRGDPCSEWRGVSCHSGRVVGLSSPASAAPASRASAGPAPPPDPAPPPPPSPRVPQRLLLPPPRPLPRPAALPTTLALLDLRASAINGSVPSSLARLLPALALQLPLRPLPASLLSLPSLRLLNLSHNLLTGPLPTATTTTSPNSSVFDLSANRFYGPVPSSFDSLLARFESVDISRNYLDGDPGIVGNPRKNVAFELNCFRNASNQRTPGECQGFYSSRGIKPYDGPVTVTPPSSNKKSHKNLKYILIAALGGATVLVVSVTAAVLCCTLCVRRNAEQRSSAVTAVPPGPAGPMGRQQAPVSVTLATVGDVFTYDQLLRATSEFADGNLVKHGHSGNLYRGVLQGGDPVIVKRVKNGAYAAELNLFSRGLHDRLVPFLGHCLSNEDEKFLIYRFMPNGDLANALHRKSEKDEDRAQSLDWIKRLKIAIGVAEALSYLHHECAPPLVHRDIQASSILLDDKFEVRLGSLSDVCPQEGEGHQNVITRASQQQGSSGSPSATCAYDVYCFGKVLLELVTGKLGISGSTDAATNEWLERAVPYINIYEKDLIAKIVDPTLIIDEDHLEEVWAMAIVAKSCLNPKPLKRPPVRYILRALENPLKVVREDHSSSLRATSSRRSWNAAFWGSWRQSLSDMPGPLKEDRILRRSSTTRSQGSNGEHSFSSHKRGSKDIFPEPSEVRDVED